MNRGVQADGLRPRGCRGYVCEAKSITNMLEGTKRSFWTPEGARKTWEAWRMEIPPPVPVTCQDGLGREDCLLGRGGELSVKRMLIAVAIAILFC
jgi:hypothetical protein